MRTALRNRYLGFIFQFHHLLPAFNAEENVLMPVLAGVGRVSRDDRERARALLERVGAGRACAQEAGAIVWRAAAAGGNCSRADQPAPAGAGR